ncbi:MAG TPA: UDP-N-acetylglucosamine 4,6-dehydratase (inverting) [Planctomycetota bacterium]|nr:UDP-N-acetylglucosamine 4,6-dehydratase (inverting) [Planctomycetota bacterium]
MSDWSQLSVLVTGGTGSFGQKFVEIVLKEKTPRRLIVFSRDELKQHDMAGRFKHPSLRFFLGDVRDRERVRRALVGVDLVVHAAALKQVPACEYNPMEAVRTNIEGGANIIDAAIDRGVKKVLALSTDKAVSPVNLYGATKLVAEKLVIQGNTYAGATGTRFACVRYGNVIGSRGSVVPAFREQARRGEITITDERMTRFWLSLDQGVRFVLASIERMKGGELFVPKIPSMRVTDLAAAIAPSARTRVVGIRPGEKLHEMLLSEDEARHARDMGDHYVVYPEFEWWSEEHLNGGKPLPDGFRYVSNDNPKWLNRDDLARLVRDSDA